MSLVILESVKLKILIMLIITKPFLLTFATERVLSIRVYPSSTQKAARVPVNQL